MERNAKNTGTTPASSPLRGPDYTSSSLDFNTISKPQNSSSSSGSRSIICRTAWNNDSRACPITIDNNISAISILPTHLANVSNLHDLPEDVLLAIFGLFLEQDLCRVAQVCRRFRELSNNSLLWRRLYKQVFQYERPLFHPQPCTFEFQSLEGDFGGNPWKESFRQLYHGVHVRPGYQRRAFCGRKIIYFENVLSALAFTNESVYDDNTSGNEALIFVHAGTYREDILINFNVALIGAAAKDVNKSVILESKSTSTVTILKGARKTYVGHFTLICSPISDSTIEYHEYNCLDIFKRCSPVVENCIFLLTSPCGSAIRVRGRGANPIIQNCLISDCEGRGLYVQNNAEGSYVNNEFCRTRLTGIWVKDMANPRVFRNVIHNGYGIGISVSGRAMGVFKEVGVHKNRTAALVVSEESTPIIVDSEFTSEEGVCVYFYERASGYFTGNRLCSSIFPAIRILTGSEPTVFHNKIVNSQVGVCITRGGKAVIQENEIIGSFTMGIRILKSNPIIRKNKILHGKRMGIYVGDHSHAVIEENEIDSNATSGLFIANGSSTSIRRNRIHSGNDGVYFEFQGHGTVEHNSIFNNANYNMIIKSGSSPFIHRNKIWGAGNGGVLISDEGLGYVEGNTIYDNNKTGVEIINTSTCLLKCNKIFDNKGYGVRVLCSGIGILEDNDIFRNSHSGVLICTQSNACLRRNRIFCGFAAGMEISHNGTANLENNHIFSNRFGGLCLATGVQPVLQDNGISCNGDELEKAVSDGLCIFALSENTMLLMHNYYICQTCSASDANTICENCMTQCHSGHEVTFVRRDKFKCACGGGALGNPCQLRGEPQGHPFPSLHADVLEIDHKMD